MKKIQDVKAPQVGRYYLVPCYRRKDYNHTAWWPVTGTWHEDADIGFHRHHYHYDVRFFSVRQLNSSIYRKLHPIGHQLLRVAVSDDDVMEATAPPLVLRRRKMMRPMPVFPAFLDGNKIHIASVLEEQFKDVKLKCKTCPHRGMSLEQLPVAVDGTVVCNGHGLKWHLETGSMVPRKEVEDVA